MKVEDSYVMVAAILQILEVEREVEMSLFQLIPFLAVEEQVL
jgi:hypothetical protein